MKRRLLIRDELWVFRLSQPYVSADEARAQRRRIAKQTGIHPLDSRAPCGKVPA